MFSTPGKVTLAICCSIVLFSFTRIMQLSNIHKGTGQVVASESRKGGGKKDQ